MALKADGTVIAWGRNFDGETNVPLEARSDVRAISAGGHHAVALRSDGTLVAWGDNSSGQTTIPWGLDGATAVAAGTNHTVALRSDQTPIAWGYGGNGQFLPPVDLAGLKSIATRASQSVALMNSTVTFVDQLPGPASEAETFTVKNTGPAPLHIAGVDVIGGDAADFTVNTSDMLDSIPSGGQTTFSVTFSPAATGTKRTTLRVLSNDLDVEAFDIELIGNPATPLENWRQKHFGTTANTGSAADRSDFDHDGLPNLIEYALGTDPLTPTFSNHRPRSVQNHLSPPCRRHSRHGLSRGTKSRKSHRLAYRHFRQ